MPGAPPRVHEGTQHRVDAGLIAGTMRLESIEHIRIQAEINPALGARNPQHDGILPAFG
jgi:hypothetical protein